MKTQATHAVIQVNRNWGYQHIEVSFCTVKDNAPCGLDAHDPLDNIRLHNQQNKGDAHSYAWTVEADTGRSLTSTVLRELAGHVERVERIIDREYVRRGPAGDYGEYVVRVLLGLGIKYAIYKNSDGDWYQGSVGDALWYIRTQTDAFARTDQAA